MTTRGKNLMAALTLTLLPLVWLWPSVFGGKTFVPFDPAQFPPASMTLTPTELETARADANLDVTEVWPWLLPEMRLIQRDLGPFELSDWNPHARTGSPLHEAGVHGPLYPPHWLWRGGMRPRDSLVWIVWINLALAGLFTYGLLRHVRLPPLAAWFGAITFQLSGVLAANGFFWTRQPGLVWLPGMLWALLRLADGDRLRPGALAATAVAVAMPWLAGFPPYAAAGLVLTSLLAFRLVLERAGLEGGRAARLLAIRLLLGLGLGLLLAMPQLLPSAWFYAFEASRTANPTLESVRAMRFDGYGLLGYLMPDAFGHPVAERELPYALQPLTYLWCDRFDATGKALLPNYNYTEYSVFAGTLGALLGLFGLARGHGHMRGTVAVMLTVIFGLALFVPVVRWLNYLPLVKNVFPMRWLGPGSLFVAWMAAIGFARLAEVETKRVVRFALFAFALAILAFWLCGWPLADHAADPEWPGSTIAARYRIPTADAIAYLQDGAGGVDRFARAGERFAAAGSEAGWWLLLSGALLLLFALIRPARARGAALGALALA
ncbi:MAG: hypothetical protein KDE27_04220, partial [Planctomycetes bacterium]|nr:hypothetical protein [Planctomycetota bacterium]